MRYRALIIDDEKLARERLTRLLQDYQDQIQLIGEATDGKEGLKLAETLQADLLFLDIQMPILDGFQMLQKLSYSPQIIFTTAYDEYALQAFEENSIDYLLKPIEKERLQRSIKKLFQHDSQVQNEQVSKLLAQIQNEQLRTIPIHKAGKIILLKIEQIVYLEAQDKYLQVMDQEGISHLISGSLKEFEQKLGPSFLRIHRSLLINTEHILEIRKSFNGKFNFILTKQENNPLQSSQSYTPLIKKLLQI